MERAEEPINRLTTRSYDMRIPKSEFTDADLKLCRAHGASVAHGRVMTASQPHDDAEWSRRWERAEAIAAFEAEICMPADLPLPPSYWDDLEHWLKTLAPAKPAGQEPGQSQAAPLVPGDRIIITCGNDHYFCTGDTGTVVAVDKDGDLEVQFDIHSRARKGCTWFVNPTLADRHLGCFATAEEEHLS